MLPEITNLTTHNITLPSGKSIKVRKYLMKDKKEYLLRADSKSTKKEIIDTILSLIQSCILDGTNIRYFSKSDIFYIFIQLRKISEGDDFEFSYNCSFCGERNDNQKVNLSEILKVTPFKEQEINLSNGIVIVTKELSFIKYLELSEKYTNISELNLYSLANSIAYVVDKNQKYEDFTEEEMIKFLDDLDIKDFEKLFVEFIEGISKVELIYNTKCSKCGKEIPVAIGEMEDFF